VLYDLLLWAGLCVVIAAMGADPFREPAQFAVATVPRWGLAAVAVLVGRRRPLAALILLLPLGPWRFSEGFATVDMAWLLPRRGVKILPLLPTSPFIVWYAYLTGRRLARTTPALAAFCLITLVGVAVVLKYTALALGLPLVLAILRSPRGPEPAPPRRVAAAAACAAIPAPLLLTFGWMAAAGLFQGYLESQRLVLGYAANTMPDPLAFDWVRWVTQPEYRLGFPMLGLGLLAGLALTARGRRPRGLLVWGAWLLAAAASLVSQGRFFEYHSLPLVPLFAWAGAWLAAPLARWLDGWRRGLSAVLVLVLMLVHTTPSSWLRIGERIAGHAVALAGGPPVEVAPSRYERVAAVIRAHTDPHETVYVWTYDPVVMFLAERRQVSRFLYNYPMVVAWQDGRARRELLEALEEAPPAMFVVGSRDAAKHVTGNPHDSKRSFEAFTELRDWVDAHYRPLTEQDGFQFFVRRRQRGHEGPSKPRSGTPP